MYQVRIIYIPSRYLGILSRYWGWKVGVSLKPFKIREEGKRSKKEVVQMLTQCIKMLTLIF